MKTLLRDIAYACRRLMRRPGPALVIIGTLAVAIGVNTAVFSAFSNIVLKKLPYDSDGSLVVLRQQQKLKGVEVPFSPKEVIDYREQLREVRDVVEYHTMSFTVLGDERATRVQVGVVSNNFFSVLGIKPVVGRTFTPDDETTTAEAVVVLSHEYWMKQFAGERSVTQRFLTMNDKAHRIIGVLPPYVQFPGQNDLYMPTTACPFRSSERVIGSREARMVGLIGRLANGATLAGATTEASNVASRMHQAYPLSYPENAGFSTSLGSVHEEISRQARPTFLVLFGATLLVLILACANAANLLVTQQLQRRKELTVRIAVGASRGRIVQMLVVESVLLTLISGAIGLMLAYSALGTLSQLAARFSQRASEISIDGSVLVFAFGVSLLTGVAVGLLPALSRSSIVTALRESSDKSTAPEHKQNLRKVLVASQIAITFVLLVSTGLMARSIFKLQERDLGFNPEGVVVARVELNWSKYQNADVRRDFLKRVEREVAALPEAGAVAVASTYPLDGAAETDPNDRVDLIVRGATDQNAGTQSPVVVRRVTPSYFETLQVPVLGGRAFTANDDERSEQVVIVNERMAATHWPGGNAMGQSVSADQGQTWLKVVGVVGNERRYNLAEEVKPQIYVPFLQAPGGVLNVLIRTSGSAGTLERQIGHVVHQLDPEQAVDDIQSLEKLLENAVSSPRLVAVLLGAFGVAALVITLAGLAGLVAYSVSLRTREIGIRVALGAQRYEVVWMVLRQAVILTAVGLVFGHLASLIAGNLLAANLYEMGHYDPLTITGVTLLVVIAATVAACLPARRASTVNPQVAMRRL
jgi:putative ABC transport system permease protein